MATPLGKVRPPHWNLVRLLAGLGMLTLVTGALTTGATLLVRSVDKNSTWVEPLLVTALVSIVAGALSGAAALYLNTRKDRLTHSRDWLRGLEEQLAAGPFEGRLPTLADLSDQQLGVTETRYTKQGRDLYVPRPKADAELVARLAVKGPPFPFVIVTGRSTSGKSRTLVHALRKRFASDNPVVIIPRDGAALAKLAALDPEIPVGGAQALVFLNDLTSSTLLHLNAGMLEKIQRFATVVGSMAWSQYVEIVDNPSDVTTAAREALRRAGEPVAVRFGLTRLERAEAQRLYRDEEFPDGCGIAEVLVAGDRLVRKLRTGFDPAAPDKVNWPGQAVARAAIDCRRYGLDRPVRTSEIRMLVEAYLDATRVNVAVTDSVFENGLSWAADPVESQVALLRKVRASDDPEWDVLRFAVDAEDGLIDDQERPVPQGFLDALLPVLVRDEAFGVGVTAYLRGDQDGAVAALRTLVNGDGAVDGVTAAAAYNLGVLREMSDSLEAAADAYRIALATGHPDFAPRAAANLGDVLNQMSEPEEATPAYRYAIESGHDTAAPAAAFNLAGMLARLGALADAETYYRLVGGCGQPDLEQKARSQLDILTELRSPHPRTVKFAIPVQRLVETTSVFGGDFAYFMRHVDNERANLLNRLKYQREAMDEPAREAFNLGIGLTSEGDLEKAIEAYQVAIDAADPEFGPKSHYNAALLHLTLGRGAQARFSALAALRWPNARLGPLSLHRIASLLEMLGESGQAAQACRRALACNEHAQVIRIAHRLAALLRRAGEHDAAREAYQAAIESADEQTRLRAAIDLGILHAELGDYDAALSAWQVVTDTATRVELARKAAFNRALVLDGMGERARAIRDLKYAVVADDARVAERARTVLAQLEAG